MTMVVILEIVVGIVVLAAAVRFAVRDTRQRRAGAESEDTAEAPVRGGEREARQHRSEVADDRAGEEVGALSAPSTAASTAPEPPADAR